MILVVQITDISFKTIIGKVHALAKLDVGLACRSADSLIFRVLEQQDRVEQTFVTRLWITVQSVAQDNLAQPLLELLDAMTKKLAKPLGAKATHAAQILLWKVSETFFAQKKYDLASLWCRIALHLVFDRSGELNCAKIARLARKGIQRLCANMVDDLLYARYT